MFSLTRLFFLSGSGDTLRFYFDFMHRCVGVLGPCLLHPGNPDDRDMWKTYPNLWYPPENKRHIYSCRVDWNNSPPWIFCETRGSWLNLPCGSFWDYGGPAKLTCSCDRRVSWPLRVCRWRSSEVTNSKFPQILWRIHDPKIPLQVQFFDTPQTVDLGEEHGFSTVVGNELSKKNDSFAWKYCTFILGWGNDEKVRSCFLKKHVYA